MSDPQPARLKNTPRRAEPLQPDNPGQGSGVQSDTAATSPNREGDTAGAADPAHTPQSDRELKQRSETALKNVSEGYS